MPSLCQLQMPLPLDHRQHLAQCPYESCQVTLRLGALSRGGNTAARIRGEAPALLPLWLWVLSWGISAVVQLFRGVPRPMPSALGPLWLWVLSRGICIVVQLFRGVPRPMPSALDPLWLWVLSRIINIVMSRFKGKLTPLDPPCAGPRGVWVCPPPSVGLSLLPLLLHMGRHGARTLSATAWPTPPSTCLKEFRQALESCLLTLSRHLCMCLMVVRKRRHFIYCV